MHVQKTALSAAKCTFKVTKKREKRSGQWACSKRLLERNLVAMVRIPYNPLRAMKTSKERLQALDGVMTTRFASCEMAVCTSDRQNFS